MRSDSELDEFGKFSEVEELGLTLLVYIHGERRILFLPFSQWVLDRWIDIIYLILFAWEASCVLLFHPPTQVFTHYFLVIWNTVSVLQASDTPGLYPLQKHDTNGSSGHAHQLITPEVLGTRNPWG